MKKQRAIFSGPKWGFQCSCPNCGANINIVWDLLVLRNLNLQQENLKRTISFSCDSCKNTLNIVFMEFPQEFIDRIKRDIEESGIEKTGRFNKYIEIDIAVGVINHKVVSENQADSLDSACL